MTSFDDGTKLTCSLLEFSSMLGAMNKKPTQSQGKEMETTIDKKEGKEE